MPDDPNAPHPADGLVDTIRGIFNGDTFIKGIRDAWDKHMGTAPTPAPPPVDDPWLAARAKAATESFANAQNNLTPTAAAKIRAKASKTVGGK